MQLEIVVDDRGAYAAVVGIVGKVWRGVWEVTCDDKIPDSEEPDRVLGARLTPEGCLYRFCGAVFASQN
jgi:hypothetical protein